MKRAILCVLLMVTTLLGFSQGEQIADPAIFEQLFLVLGTLIPTNVLAGILTGALILEYVVTYVKWTPANSTLEFIWIWFKKIIHFLSLKKKQ